MPDTEQSLFRLQNVEHKGFMARKEQLGVRGLCNLAKAYADAARRLAEQTPVEPLAPTYTYYPVALLYRHATELYLKAIIALTCDRREDHLEAIKKGHNLKAAHTFVCKKLNSRDCIVPDKANLIARLRAAEWVIEEWERVDRTGMGFRYCVDKEVEMNVLLTTQDGIGFELQHLSSIMNETLEELGNIAAAAFSPNDLRRDVEHEQWLADEIAEALQREAIVRPNGASVDSAFEKEAT